MRILLVGSRFLPYRHGGDKNFWLDIVQGLLRAGHELEVLSIMVEDVPGNGIPLRRVPPIPFYLTPDDRFNADHRHIAGTNNYASKTISLPRIGWEIRRRRREWRPDLIHFADNYGPAMAGLRAAAGGLPLTVSAPTYNGNRLLYDVFLRASFLSFDVVVPFSDAYRRRLLELGMPTERVRRIRWGVDVERFAPASPSDRVAARAQLGVPGGPLLVLWTGFTQQTNEADLRSAVRTAELVLAKDASKVAFVFCFKPEHFKESYRGLERPGLRVFGTGEAFHAARTSADVLFCPILDRRSTAAPPLVWLECLAMGIPILTTDIPGAEEAVIAGRSGFAVRTPEDAAARLLEMGEDSGLRARLREGARQVALERYSVDRSLAEYVDLWSGLANAHP